MPTDAFDAFDRNLARAGHFITIHKDTQTKPGRPTAKMNELPRAAIVFAVGALDAYVSEASAEFLLAKLEAGRPPKELRDILRALDKELPGLALEVVLIPDAEDRRQRICDTITDHFYNNVSNHGSKAVSRFVERIGRSANTYWKSIGEYWDHPRDTLDSYTDVRHEIVHQGRDPSVTRGEADSFIDFVRNLVDLLDPWVEAGL